MKEHDDSGFSKFSSGEGHGEHQNPFSCTFVTIEKCDISIISLKNMWFA